MKIDKNIINSNKQLIVGAKKLASTVAETMGAKGNFVVIQDYNNMQPVVTKDGVTVANAVDLEDIHEMLGAKLIKEAADKMLSEVGDSTTTVSVLTAALLQETDNVKNLVKEYEVGLSKSLVELKKMSKKLTKKELRQVATLSANGDKEIGDLVYKAFSEVGEYGSVLIEDSFSPKDEITFEEGTTIDQGWLSQFFITNIPKLTVELENPYVLIAEDKVERFDALVPVMEFCNHQNRPLLLIVDDIDDVTLNKLILNHTQKLIKLCVIRSPKFGDQRHKLIQDLTYLTKAKTQNGFSEVYDISSLGEAIKFVAKATQSSLITEKDSSFEDYLKEVSEDVTDDKSFDLYRRAILDAKMATIKVGGLTPAEQKERRDRFDDSVGATRSAYKNGVVPGAGNALAWIGQNLGGQFGKALKEPMNIIYHNAGLESNETVEFNKGFNVATEEFLEDLKADGIVDSTYSTMKALEVAVSVAKTILQTKVSIQTLN